jgi:predicted DNA-binding protein (UPF0251 family)
MLIILARRFKMARPICPRTVKNLPNVTYYKPRAIPMSELEEVALTYDEFEALRLADLEGLYQEMAAIKMKISRPTFGRIIESAHKKVADALINGKAIKIEGGVIKMAQRRVFQCSDCEHTWEVPFGTGRPPACPDCGKDNFHRVDDSRGFGGGGRGTCRRRGTRLNATAAKEEK